MTFQVVKDWLVLKIDRKKWEKEKRKDERGLEKKACELMHGNETSLQRREDA